MDFSASPTDPLLWRSFGGPCSDRVLPPGSTHFFPMVDPLATAREVEAAARALDGGRAKL
jgi:hypothetical protein